MMQKSIEQVEQAFRNLAEGSAFDGPRRRVRQRQVHLRILAVQPRIDVAGSMAGYSRRASLLHLHE